MTARRTKITNKSRVKTQKWGLFIMPQRIGPEGVPTSFYTPGPYNSTLGENKTWEAILSIAP
jgi:hypothetical protein